LIPNGSNGKGLKRSETIEALKKGKNGKSSENIDHNLLRGRL